MIKPSLSDSSVLWIIGTWPILVSISQSLIPQCDGDTDTSCLIWNKSQIAVIPAVKRVRWSRASGDRRGTRPWNKDSDFFLSMERVQQSALREKTVPENGPLFFLLRASEMIIHILYEFTMRNETFVHPSWEWVFVLQKARISGYVLIHHNR